MIPWEILDITTVPGGKEPLKLMRRGGEYSIMLGTNELMNSRLSGSEEALARLTVETLGKPDPRILIGGLGMGFTLRSALPLLGAGAHVTVAELVPEVVAWARGPLADLHAGALDDPRVEIFEGDVGERIAEAGEGWDAIVLDVDNGPEGLSRDGNDALYDARGLGRAYGALRRGGVLSVWSSGPDAGFTRRLGQAGFAVEEVAVRASTRKRGARHVVWLARR